MQGNQKYSGQRPFNRASAHGQPTSGWVSLKMFPKDLAPYELETRLYEIWFPTRQLRSHLSSIFTFIFVVFHINFIIIMAKRWFWKISFLPMQRDKLDLMKPTWLQSSWWEELRQWRKRKSQTQERHGTEREIRWLIDSLIVQVSVSGNQPRALHMLGKCYSTLLYS